MRRLPLFLIGCILILAMLPVAASAEEGEFRAGVVGEYANWNYSKGGVQAYGTDFGVLLGYEKALSDSFWYGIDGKVLHGQRKSAKAYPWRNTNVRAMVKIGTLLHYDLDIKPFIGVGVNYTDQDIRSTSNFYYTDYTLPIGVSFEKKTDFGLIATDIRYEYVVHRELYSTDGGDTGKTKTFGGNGNLEVGLSIEPKGTSIGFRPYYRYEHANGGGKNGWWGPYNQNIGGLEVYYRF